ncbi:MAG: ribonuclease III [Zymomonas mobilis subsp. pomaceae]|uniref:Ribonuclease 3 n=1 Tax=Zymomonas mobilis subsp. pomaceae (strain ATCC 29192 / DSM 22645 / JCM 10191 / CCUG 17912 / NBRC 13757 / NCIMB 11200 / NRRL B-4491 / Barker I) TaxID=579138 RepID=F8ERW2_ZYMMT|nr:ribonuclease III [Zymomonas mobilis]AEI38575.1 ribonuclease III [Zymomonas mobilis subsp. pomaceae ATCC 29192]MDX5948265.1 ribonuclease III [Zymomonas mobilis subsp. pomaceae]GEB89021.1 ribonuclease 3 [Zymomonas mobilis subsp. pomaceae]
MSNDAFIRWVEQTLGHKPKDPALFFRAMTHPSHGNSDYQRLEFLGDRVLGLVIAHWLYQLFPNEPEGKLSRRLNSLVSGASCAGVARVVGLPQWLRLGKQARDDGAAASDNVLGDVMEALIGAIFLESGVDAAGKVIHKYWASLVTEQESAPKHPKSALQEWAAAHNRRPPVYEIVSRTGPQHNPCFTILVSIAGVGQASAEGSSKQEAQTAAAQALLTELS